MQLESIGIFTTTTEIQDKLHSLRVYMSSQINKLEYLKTIFAQVLMK